MTSKNNIVINGLSVIQCNYVLKQLHVTTLTFSETKKTVFLNNNNTATIFTVNITTNATLTKYHNPTNNNGQYLPETD